MTTPDNEQARAAALAQEIDRLLTGTGSSTADPLLSIAQRLHDAPLQPSAAALARFDAQLAGWFQTPKPVPVPRRALPRLPIAAAAVAITLGAMLLAYVQYQNTPPTTLTAPPAVTLTAAPTATQTRTPTFIPSPSATVTAATATAATATAESSSTPAAATLTLTEIGVTGTVPVLSRTTVPGGATPTAIPYNQIVLHGTIDRIHGLTAEIAGQSVEIREGIGLFCVGDLVRVIATLDADGVLRSTRRQITVETTACKTNPTAAPQINGGNGKGGDGDDDKKPKKD